MLDVNRLRVIDAVAGHGSVTAAAKEWHPALRGSPRVLDAVAGFVEFRGLHEHPLSVRRPAVLHPHRTDPGRAWSTAAAREQLRHTAALAGVRRRLAPP